MPASWSQPQGAGLGGSLAAWVWARRDPEQAVGTRSCLPQATCSGQEQRQAIPRRAAGPSLRSPLGWTMWAGHWVSLSYPLWQILSQPSCPSLGGDGSFPQPQVSQSETGLLPSRSSGRIPPGRALPRGIENEVQREVMTSCGLRRREEEQLGPLLQGLLLSLTMAFLRNFDIKDLITI